MWCSLTRRGDTSDGPAGLLRDLNEMSRRTKEKTHTAKATRQEHRSPAPWPGVFNIKIFVV
jgi:hypothetical protein